MNLGRVVDARERRCFDQEVVDEQLPANVDGYGGGRMGQVGDPQRVAARLDVAGWPLGGRRDAVVGSRYSPPGPQSLARKSVMAVKNCI